MERAIEAEIFVAGVAIEVLRAAAPRKLEHLRQEPPLLLEPLRDPRRAERIV